MESKKVKIIGIDCRMVVARAWGVGDMWGTLERYCFKGTHSEI